MCAFYLGVNMEEKIINKLLSLAKKAYLQNETPISAIIVYNNKIISTAYNKRNKTQKTIDHAEIRAIIKANKKLKTWRLNKCTLYVTIEPCDMCKNVIKESRIEKVYYLLPKLETKKIYNKTEFEQLLLPSQMAAKKDEYIKLNEFFWKNLR